VWHEERATLINRLPNHSHKCTAMERSHRNAVEDRCHGMHSSAYRHHKMCVCTLFLFCSRHGTSWVGVPSRLLSYSTKRSTSIARRLAASPWLLPVMVSTALYASRIFPAQTWISEPLLPTSQKIYIITVTLINAYNNVCHSDFAAILSASSLYLCIISVIISFFSRITFFNRQVTRRS
jgi:hypothetical protein